MDLRREQLDFMKVKSLENICIYFLLKGCDLNYFTERTNDQEISLYCLLDEFLIETCDKGFYLLPMSKLGT